MIAPRWKKVLRDLWGNKTRTLLVVLSIAVGVFAVGAVTHTFTIVSQELAVTYPKANPAAATIYTEAFDDDLVQMVRRMPGVGEVEARTMTIVQMQVGDEWKSLYLFAISDFNDIRINKVKPQGGYKAAPDFHAERGCIPDRGSPGVLAVGRAGSSGRPHDAHQQSDVRLPGLVRLPRRRERPGCRLEPLEQSMEQHRARTLQHGYLARGDGI